MAGNTVWFAHGKESGPRGVKIQALARVAESRGWKVVSPDYSSTMDPEERVKMLIEEFRPGEGKVVLAGSSMGGYVSMAASERIRPDALFLMAPAVGIPGYSRKDPNPVAPRTVIVHGLGDEIVPPDGVVAFSRRHRTELHLVEAGHDLREAIPFLEFVFGKLLDEVSGCKPGGRIVPFI